MRGARRIEVGKTFMFNARGSRAGHIGTSPMTNIHPSTNDLHGARTFDLPIPRRTPYPLGHGDRYVCQQNVGWNSRKKIIDDN
ncbi:hypothetical protein DPMN_109993 [Dreissena polymorpha]|uniref:Uncharacterized protein n=1 Tax=Dreissena polymorpha TaxID=45954 RepID=A0A9D4KC41_DREPO|nr:hypothetical protein DPMN_109993 [Dreissena polymorpha]